MKRINPHKVKDCEIESLTADVAGLIDASGFKEVVFEDGKRCDDVTDASSGFAMSGDCYVTSWITLGGTSSLRFKETGTFAYTVEMTTGGESRKGSGEIVVRQD